MRYLLEHGRTFNSADNPERARPLFLQALSLARDERLEGLAVDAAHMLAITYTGKPEAIDWNRRGLGLAPPSTDAKSRELVPAILENAAWNLRDMQRYDEALLFVRAAQAELQARGRPEQVRFATYVVGRCLRLMGRRDEALAIQQVLEPQRTQIDAARLRRRGTGRTAARQGQARGRPDLFAPRSWRAVGRRPSA